MAFETFAAFLSELERRGELRRIARPVDPVLEITEICDRTVKRGGPALLFEQPVGSTIPVAINTFGSMRRMCLALGWTPSTTSGGRSRNWSRCPRRCRR